MLRFCLSNVHSELQCQPVFLSRHFLFRPLSVELFSIFYLTTIAKKVGGAYSIEGVGLGWKVYTHTQSKCCVCRGKASQGTLLVCCTLPSRVVSQCCAWCFKKRDTSVCACELNFWIFWFNITFCYEIYSCRLMQVCVIYFSPGRITLSIFHIKDNGII